MAPKTKAVLKIVVGVLLVVGGLFGTCLIQQGVDDLGRLNQMQLK